MHLLINVTVISQNSSHTNITCKSRHGALSLVNNEADYISLFSYNGNVYIVAPEHHGSFIFLGIDKPSISTNLPMLYIDNTIFGIGANSTHIVVETFGNLTANIG